MSKISPVELMHPITIIDIVPSHFEFSVRLGLPDLVKDLYKMLEYCMTDFQRTDRNLP